MENYVQTAMLSLPKQLVFEPEEISTKNVRILAIDGGGTKTSATILDTSTGECVTGNGGGSNMRSIDLEDARSGVAEAVNAALALTSDPSNSNFDISVAIIASNDTPNQHEKFNSMLKTLVNAKTRISCNDTLGAWSAATTCLPGISFISGTGSQCLAVDDNHKVWSAGGCDWYMGDEGSGYQIGKLAINAVFKFNDSRGPKTLLTDIIYDHFKVYNSYDLLNSAHDNANPKAYIASAAICATEAANAGDEIAQNIFKIAAKDIAEHAQGIMNECYFDRKEIIFGFTGSTTKAGDVFMNPIKEELAKVDSRLKPARAQLSAALGTALLGLRFFWGQKAAAEYIKSVS